MSGVLNDCDALLQSADVRFLVGKGIVINLVASAPGFHLNSAGVPDLSKVTVTADLIGFDGTVSFSASGGTLTNATARSVDVNYASGAAVVKATITAGGETFTRSLTIPVLRDGAAGTNGSNGTNGTSPNKNGIAFLYKWATSAPAKPSGTSTFGWSTASNTAYGGNDGWSISVPNNPGTPLIQLFVASIAVTDVAVATSTTVSYASSIVAAWAQNGANGTNGSNGTNGATGVQSGEAKVYQWAATIPAGPVGSPTFTWSTSAFGAAPTNWTLTPGTAPSPGMTLWMARVGLTDSAAATTTSFNWTAASILAVGYAGANGTNGSNGTNGDAGAEGVSYVTAYCASTTASTTTAPSPTPGKTSVPAVNGGGITGTWSKTVPALSSGQFMYQSDGLYNPATNQVTWSIPYWSSLKVGTLSAITANLGAITGGSIDIGSGATSWHVDAQGNMWIGAALFASAPFRVTNGGAVTATNVTITGGAMDIGSGATSFHVDSAGNHWAGAASYNDAPYKVSNTGVMSATSGTFSGVLSAAGGTIGSLHMPTGGSFHSGIYTSWQGWLAGGGPGFFMDPSVIALGNYAIGKYVILYSDGNVYMPGFKLESGQLTLTSPVIVSPIFDSFTASLSGGALTSSGVNGSRSLGSRQIIGSGGKTPYRSFLWVVTDLEGNAAARTTISGETTDTVSVSASGTNASTRVRITGIITDANGMTASASFISTANFGTV